MFIDLAYHAATVRQKDAEIIRLTQENERMREALVPFANVYDKDVGDGEHPDDIFKPMMKYNHAPLIKIGDLKRAYIVINPIPDPAGGMPVEVKT